MSDKQIRKAHIGAPGIEYKGFAPAGPALDSEPPECRSASPTKPTWALRAVVDQSVSSPTAWVQTKGAWDVAADRRLRNPQLGGQSSLNPSALAVSAAVGDPLHDFRRLVAEVKAQWPAKNHRGRPPGIGTPGDMFVFCAVDRAHRILDRLPPVGALRELIATIGHSSYVAALRSRHATAERNQAIADYLDDVIDAARRTPKSAPVRRRPN